MPSLTTELIGPHHLPDYLRAIPLRIILAVYRMNHFRCVNWGIFFLNNGKSRKRTLGHLLPHDSVMSHQCHVRGAILQQKSFAEIDELHVVHRGLHDVDMLPDAFLQKLSWALRCKYPIYWMSLRATELLGPVFSPSELKTHLSTNAKFSMFVQVFMLTWCANSIPDLSTCRLADILYANRRGMGQESASILSQGDVFWVSRWHASHLKVSLTPGSRGLWFCQLQFFSLYLGEGNKYVYIYKSASRGKTHPNYSFNKKAV